MKRFGGDSWLSPENVLCGKDRNALGAALVDFDSTPLRVNHDQLNPASYFGADGTFKIPEVCRRKKAFWVQTNPSVLHPYDMSLPRPIAGIEAPGKELLALFAREKCGHTGTSDPTTQPGLNLVNRFKNMCTGIDQTTAKMLREATDTIFSFDATEVSEADRKVASMAKAGISKDHVGSFEKGAAVIEPRQVLKQLGDETSTVVRKLIAPWEEKKRAEIAKQAGKNKKAWEDALKDASTEGERADANEVYKAEMAQLDRQGAKVQQDHVTYKRELFDWGGEKFFRAFTSRYDRDSIPTGYRAVWDGLMTELKDTENGSACIAVCEDLQLTDSHKSVYSHALNFWGRWFEHDCFRTFAVSNKHRPSPARSPSLRSAHRRWPRLAPAGDALLFAERDCDADDDGHRGRGRARHGQVVHAQAPAGVHVRGPRRQRRQQERARRHAGCARFCWQFAQLLRSRPTRFPQATTTRKTAASCTPTR